MIEIKPNGLYSRRELDALLRPHGVDVDGWLAKIRPARRFRPLYFGEDLLEAIRRTPPLGNGGSVSPEPKPAHGGNGRRKAGDDLQKRLEPLQRLIRKSSHEL